MLLSVVRQARKFPNFSSPIRRKLSTLNHSTDWSFISSIFANTFTQGYRFSNEAVAYVSDVTRQPAALILSGHLDHVTYNLTNKIHYERTAKYLEQQGLQVAKKLVFQDGMVDGTLFWLPEDSPHYRQKYDGKPKVDYKPGIQGVFTRFFKDSYLEEVGCGSLVNHDPGEFDTRSFFTYLQVYKPQLSLMNDDLDDGNFMLKKHFENGALGHYAVDMYSLGSTLEDMVAHITEHKAPFSTHSVTNHDNTIRQLYLAEPTQSFDVFGVENEPFLELIEREVIDSVSAVGERE